jgi:hypothetical protein
VPEPRRDGYLLLVARGARNFDESRSLVLPLLEELAARHPGLPVIRLELAEALPPERETDAFAALKDAQALAPGWARPYFHQALLHERRGDVAAARADWQAFVALREADPSARAYGLERLRVLRAGP